MPLLNRARVAMWPVLLALCLGLGVARGGGWCPQKCTCDRNTSGDRDISCPADQDSRLTVHYRPDKSVYVQCTSTTSPDDFALLDGLETGPAPALTLTQCPLPPTPLRNLTLSIGVSSLTSLLFQLYSNVTEQLTTAHLAGMHNLTKLRLISSGFTDLPADLLKDLNNLTFLDLRDNYVRLPRTFFSYVPKLSSLELGSNRLTGIEPGLFQNLSQLKLLNLWSNRLTTFSGEEFSNLTALESLDLHSNFLQSVPSAVFRDLVNLTHLNLDSNNFSSLPSDLFSKTPSLKQLRLSNNHRSLALPGGFLANLKMLKEIFLIRNRINSVPENLFEGSSALINISLSGNHLTDLPENLFNDLTELEVLDLNFNRLKTLPDGIFRSNKKLKILQLGANRLTQISADLFKGMKALEELDLDLNELSVIDGSAFTDLTELRVAHFAHNQLSLDEGLLLDWSPFNPCVKLQKLYLANNSIAEIFQDWTYTMLQLKHLDLSHNSIKILQAGDLAFLSQDVTIDLRHNQITTIKHLETLGVGGEDPPNRGVPRVLLASNPLICDCRAFSLAEYAAFRLPSSVYGFVRLELDDLKCGSPEPLQGRLFTNVAADELVCPVPPGMDCPPSCHCALRPYDKALVVNCSGQSLTQVPEKLPWSLREKLASFVRPNHTELILENNLLTSLPNVTRPDYESLTHLFLSRNQLISLDTPLINPRLVVLTVDHNNLTGVSVETARRLNNATSLRLVMLHANPWACDCQTRDLLSWLQRRYKLVKYLGNVTCLDGRALNRLSAGDLCPAPFGLIVFCASAASLGVLIGVMASLYYRYHHGVRVWLYAHRLCLWLVTEDELDRDKRFDAFVSFSHKDEEFVVQELVPRLEASGLTLCLHYRDWVAGEWIAAHIARSVEESRRTLVVLSPNFLQSEWGRHEFRAAHKQALSEGRARVVMILYGDLPPKDQLDPELRSYISLNTYVKWGDPWFWEKLRYALPHAPISPKKKKKMIDRMELIRPAETPTSVPTTPPVFVPPSPSECAPPAVC